MMSCFFGLQGVITIFNILFMHFHSICELQYERNPPPDTKKPDLKFFSIYLIYYLCLSTVNPGAIRSALTYGNQSLKPLVAGMLLKNPDMVEAINSQYPTWLDLIIPLANDRNKFASHAGGKSISKENVMEHLSSVDELLIVLERFLGSK